MARRSYDLDLSRRSSVHGNSVRARNAPSAAAALAAFLARTEFPWTEERRDKSKSYDLRAMVASAGATAIDGGARIACRMRASQESMARPEQILAALFPGFEGQDFCRVSLILDEVSPARDLYRRRGRFLE